MQSHKLAPFIILMAALVLLSACAPAAASSSQSGQATAPNNPVPATGSVQLTGAGATFPQPLYMQWTYAYQYVDPSVSINYQGIGSGGGKKAIIDGTVDFAGSDSLVTDAEYAAGKDLQMLPAVAGAVVPIYNVSGITASDPKLVLDRQTLVDIFNAKVTKWNDPEIAKLNDALKAKLPDKQITVVHRSDGSGTTETFTRALTSFSPDWKAGGAQSVEWPVDKAGNGIGGKGNPGVAAAVTNTPNSIGYVELDYAVANNIAYADMINKAGQKVTANGASINSAMKDFANTFTDKMTNVIVNAPGAGSWPIAGYTYYVVHMTSMNDCTKAQKLVQYITWTLTDANAGKLAASLGYAVLPADVQKSVLAKLDQIQCNGKPVVTK